MQIIQLPRKLSLAPDIEVVISWLPEWVRRVGIELARNYLLEHLQSHGQALALRLAQQQMHVLGHDDKSGQVKAVPAARSFERSYNNVTRLAVASSGARR
jgi:hypothetical protein